jgi:hypothetical protein
MSRWRGNIRKRRSLKLSPETQQTLLKLSYNPRERSLRSKRRRRDRLHKEVGSQKPRRKRRLRIQLQRRVQRRFMKN